MIFDAHRIMSALPATKSYPGTAFAVEWVPILAGLLLLYVPTIYGLATGLWKEDDYAHGPIILGIIIWLVWDKRRWLLAPPTLDKTETIRAFETTASVSAAAVSATAPRDAHHGTVESTPYRERLILNRSTSVTRALGLALLLFGLLLYAVGRPHDITLVEVGSLAPIMAGVLLAMRGWPSLRAFWFPILFVIFMVPLPGIFVDALTAPLKQSISAVAEQILYAAGYPIARTGIVLNIGQYQLLIADACSGINSMFSLSALGLLYLYFMRRQSVLHNGLIVICLLPIAYCANILRVIFLVLVTYHFGDAAGQGFLHGGAGMVLLVVSLSCVFLFDAVLARIIKPRTAA